MQIVRTIVWVVLLAALLVFSFFNWRPVEVTIWNNLVLETRLPALVVVSFLLGLLPMWLVHRGSKWTLNRRISALETANRANAQAAAAAVAAPPPVVDPVPAYDRPVVGAPVPRSDILK